MIDKLSDKQIDGMHKHMHEHAIAMLTTQGELTNLLHAFTADGQEIVIPLIYDDETKATMLHIIKHALVEAQAIALFIVAEAWGSIIPKEEIDAYNATDMTPSTDPNRKEVVILHYISHDEIRMTTYNLMRDANGVFSGLGEPRVMSSKDAGAEEKPSGNFVDLLPPKRGLLPTNGTETVH